MQCKRTIDSEERATVAVKWPNELQQVRGVNSRKKVKETREQTTTPKSQTGSAHAINLALGKTHHASIPPHGPSSRVSTGRNGTSSPSSNPSGDNATARRGVGRVYMANRASTVRLRDRAYVVAQSAHGRAGWPIHFKPRPRAGLILVKQGTVWHYRLSVCLD